MFCYVMLLVLIHSILGDVLLRYVNELQETQCFINRISSYDLGCCVNS